METGHSLCFKSQHCFCGLSVTGIWCSKTDVFQKHTCRNTKYHIRRQASGNRKQTFIPNLIKQFLPRPWFALVLHLQWDEVCLWVFALHTVSTKVIMLCVCVRFPYWSSWFIAVTFKWSWRITSPQRGWCHPLFLFYVHSPTEEEEDGVCLTFQWWRNKDNKTLF